MALFQGISQQARRYSRAECAAFERYQDDKGRWVTLEEGQHVYIEGGKVHPSGPGSKSVTDDTSKESGKTPAFHLGKDDGKERTPLGAVAGFGKAYNEFHENKAKEKSGGTTKVQRDIREDETYGQYKARKAAEKEAKHKAHGEEHKGLKEATSQKFLAELKRQTADKGWKKLADRLELKAHGGSLEMPKRITPEQREFLEKLNNDLSGSLGKEYAETAKALREKHGVKHDWDMTLEEQETAKKARTTPAKGTPEREALERDAKDDKELASDLRKAELEDIKEGGDVLNKMAADHLIREMEGNKSYPGFMYDLTRAVAKDLEKEGLNKDLAGHVLQEIFKKPGIGEEFSQKGIIDRLNKEHNWRRLKDEADKGVRQLMDYRNDVAGPWQSDMQQFRDRIKSAKSEAEIKSALEDARAFTDAHHETKKKENETKDAERKAKLEKEMPELEGTHKSIKDALAKIEETKHFLPKRVQEQLKDDMDDLDETIRDFKLGQDRNGDKLTDEDKERELEHIKSGSERLHKNIGNLEKGEAYQRMQKLHQRASGMKGEDGEVSYQASKDERKSVKATIYGDLAVDKENGNVIHAPTGLIMERTGTPERGKMLVKLLKEGGHDFSFKDVKSMGKDVKDKVPWIVKNFRENSIDEFKEESPPAAAKAEASTTAPKDHGKPAVGKEYRGFKVEAYEGTNVGYAPQRHNKQTHTLTNRTRQVKGYDIHYPDGGSKFVDTLKEAKEYIDNWHGDEKPEQHQAATHPHRYSREEIATRFLF